MKRVVRYRECVDAMSTIGRDVKNNFRVAVNPDRSRSGDCYFKYYDSQDYSSAKHVVRIDFRSPSVFVHRNRDGLKTWNLNADARKNLVNFLSAKSTRYRNVTNWQLALYYWDYESGFLNDSYPDTYNSDIEAFVDGHYDTPDNLSNPSYVSSDLTMPDYTRIRQ